MDKCMSINLISPEKDTLIDSIHEKSTIIYESKSESKKSHVINTKDRTSLNKVYKNQSSIIKASKVVNHNKTKIIDYSQKLQSIIKKVLHKINDDSETLLYEEMLMVKDMICSMLKTGYKVEKKLGILIYQKEKKCLKYCTSDNVLPYSEAHSTSSSDINNGNTNSIIHWKLNNGKLYTIHTRLSYLPNKNVEESMINSLISSYEIVKKTNALNFNSVNTHQPNNFDNYCNFVYPDFQFDNSIIPQMTYYTLDYTS